MITRTLVLAAAFAVPTAVLAAGGGGSTAPASTETTTTCENGMIWDKASKSCVAAQDSRLQDSDRMEAAREFAYVGDYDATLGALDAMADASTADALTLRGFALRKSGDWEQAMSYYTAALEVDPNHWQARSYMGQGFVSKGDSASAREQLTLIRTSGGRGTWAEISLRQAIESGAGYSY